MGIWLTTTEFKAQSLHPRVLGAAVPEARLTSLIDSVEAQIQACFDLDISKTGFTAAAKEAVMQIVETTLNMYGGVTSRSQGKRSESYDINVVERIVRITLGGYIKTTNSQLMRSDR
jgi:hypothetical protein